MCLISLQVFVVALVASGWYKDRYVDKEVK